MAELTTRALRTAAFLATRQRLDAGFKPSGKTRKNVKCNPPNKKCKGRCIPPNWNCRATGQGTDSHSKAVEFDPVRGTNNIIRGTKNVIEGVKQSDPEKITRGIKGIERGVVKVTPGDTLEQKERFRKRVKAIGSVAFISIVAGIITHKSHTTLKTVNPRYRNGLGADIDRAVLSGVERVADTWDAGVDRIGLGSVFGTNRAAIARSGRVAAQRIGRAGALTSITEAKFNRDPRFTTYLQTRSRLRGGAPGIAAVKDIDTQARLGNWTREEWEASKVSALYSMRSGNNSVFAAPAAHELLASQWGFQLPQRALRESGRVNEISLVRYRLLPEAVSQMHTSLRNDMARRNIPMNSVGVNTYVNQLLSEDPSIIASIGSRTERIQLEQEFRHRMSEIINATNGTQQRAVANNTYNRTVSFFDEYFTRSAEALSTTDRRLNIRPNQEGSPFGDAMMGLSRLHSGQGRNPVRARDRTTASFLNGWYYHTRIRNQRTPYVLRNERTALQIASTFSGQAVRSREEALAWFNSNGFRVRIPSPRGRRSDAGPSTGQRCGDSHIPKTHKCHKGKTAESSSAVAANKHDKTYHVRRVASLVARVGAVAGGAAMVVAGVRNAKQGKNPDTASKLVVYGAGLSFFALKSLEREQKTTYNSDQLVERYEKLKKVDSVDAATVERLQKFIQETDLDSQRVSTQLTLAGLGGYFDTAQPDRVHISTSGHTVRGAVGGDPAKSYSDGVAKFMRYRSKAKDSILSADNENQKFKDLLDNFSGSAWIRNPDGKADYLLAHEIAHAIHYRSKFATPKAVVVNGKRYEGEALQRELMRSTSYYGQSDLFKRADSTDNYYDQGNRLETYAENFALYVGNAKAMKEYFPVSYEWTRQTTEHALNQKPQVKPRPFLDVVNDLSKGARQFEPARRSRRDAPEDEAAAMNLYRSMRTAAVNGDTAEALQLFAQAQQLPEEYRFMFGSLLETAFMYATIKEANGAA